MYMQRFLSETPWGSNEGSGHQPSAQCWGAQCLEPSAVIIIHLSPIIGKSWFCIEGLHFPLNQTDSGQHLRPSHSTETEGLQFPQLTDWSLAILINGIHPGTGIITASLNCIHIFNRFSTWLLILLIYFWPWVRLTALCSPDDSAVSNSSRVSVWGDLVNNTLPEPQGV